MIRLAALCLSLLLVACESLVSSPPAPPAAAVPTGWPAPVGQVPLRQPDRSGDAVLDVGVAIFAMGLAGSRQPGAAEVFPEIRKAESILVPVRLRSVLQDSGQWGAVRVLPRASESVAVLVSGQIVHSDGRDLVLDVRAEDAAGRVWLEGRYHDRALPADYPVAADADPFADVYRAIANDLLAAREQQALRSRAELADLALLRFASNLAPAVFGEYLSADANGLLRLSRLPAQDDSMLRRVARLQRQEFLFIDTADEQYQALVAKFTPTYNLWREYNLELLRYEEDFREHAGEREFQGRRGTFSAMQQTYTTFRRAKIQEQDLYDLAVGFDNEVTDTVIDVDDRVFKLNGSLEEQAVEWRRILQQIFTLESGT